MIRFSYVVSKFAFNSIIMTFLYINMCIVCDFYKCRDSLIMFLIPKSFFYYLFIIKYNFALSLILKVLIFKRSRFIFIKTFSIIFFSD